MTLPEAWVTDDTCVDAFLLESVRGYEAPPEMYFSLTPMVKIFTEPQELKKLLSRLRDAGASQAGIVKLVNLRDSDHSPRGGACPLTGWQPWVQVCV